MGSKKPLSRWLDFYQTPNRRMIINPFRYTSPGGIALLASTTGSSTGNNAATTSAMDTTGASLLVLLVSGANGTTISDSKGNTWTALTLTSAHSYFSRLYYSVPTSVGSGHTFTAAVGVFGYFGVVVAAFGGVGASPFDKQAATSASGTTIQPGSVTPAADNSLLVTGLGTDNAGTTSIDSSFSIIASAAYVGGQVYGASLAYKVQTTATAENPTWTKGGSSGGLISNIAVFK